MKKSVSFAAGLLLVCAVVALGAGASKLPAVKTGDHTLAFEVKATDGKTLKFPGDYRGKVVLLDFWATWCPDCFAEMPNVVSAYDTYHSNGFDIVGISLDEADAAKKLDRFTKEHGMPWREVFDGKYWQAEVAVQYNIRSTPSAFLIDGDTGLVLASGKEALGTNLAPAIAKALAAKATKK